MYTLEELSKVSRRKELINLAEEKGYNISKVLSKLRYEEELRLLQAELVNLQHWVTKKRLRVAIIMEGRDAAGKGGTIKSSTMHRNSG